MTNYGSWGRKIIIAHAYELFPSPPPFDDDDDTEPRTKNPLLFQGYNKMATRFKYFGIK